MIERPEGTEILVGEGRVEPAGRSESTVQEGIVYRKFQGWYTVRIEGADLNCRISSKLRKHLTNTKSDDKNASRRITTVREIRAVDPVAIGDRVRFHAAEGEQGVITEVLPRRNRLSRRAAGNKPIEQVIAANVDQVMPVFAVAQPWPTWGLLDRYLASVEEAGLPALLCMTKNDLLRDAEPSAELAEELEELQETLEVYRQIGYPIFLTSSETGEGTDELKAALRGKVTVLLGKSGVGKTTLLNRLQPGLGLRVNEVSERTGKGQHTTTNLSMFDLDDGGCIIDTPGMREFMPWLDADENLSMLFREIRPYVEQCRYGEGCHHREDPGCAVREAVERGEIDEQRYESFLSLVDGDD